MKSSVKTKIYSMLFGTILALILLELGLRISGMILLSSQKEGAIEGIDFDDASQYRILCLGESTTAEWFAGDRRNSWPFQLEGILNRNAKDGRHYKVINEGISGTMTAFILARLEENLEKYRPQMVVTMMGINDNQAPIYYDDTLGTKIHLFLIDLRVVKFFRILFGAVAEKGHLGEDQSAPRYTDQLYGAIRDRTKIDTIRTLIVQQKNLEAGRSAYNALREAYPGLAAPLDRFYTMELAWVAKRDLGFDAKHFDYLEERFTTFLEAPYPSSKERGLTYVGLSSLYRATKQDAEYVRTIKEGLPYMDFDGDKHVAMMQLSMIQDRAETPYPEINEIFEKYQIEYRPTSRYGATRTHYQQIYEILKAHNLKYVAMQYPTRNIRLIKYFLSGKTDQAVETSERYFFSDDPGDAYDDVLADDPNVLFVSNKETFEAALKTEPWDAIFIDRFGGSFGHTTGKGNRLIAEHLASEILKSRLRSAPDR